MDNQRTVEEILADLHNPEFWEEVPDPGKPWRLDQLVRELEGQLLHPEPKRGPLMLLWPRLCDLTKERCLAAYLLFQIALVNCLRRASAGYNFQEIDWKLTEIENQANRLSNSDPRKHRLLELRFYHGGIHADNKGDYREGGKMLLGAAKVATHAGKRPTAAINRWRARQSLAYAALMDGPDQAAEFVQRKFGLRDAKRLQKALKGTSEEAGLWNSYNIFVPLAVVYYLAGITPTKALQEYIFKGLEKFLVDDPNASEHLPGIWVAMAIGNLWKNRRERALAMCDKILETWGATPNEYSALAIFIQFQENFSGELEMLEVIRNLAFTPKYLKGIIERRLKMIAYVDPPEE